VSATISKLDQALESLKSNTEPSTEHELLRTYLILALALQHENDKLKQQIAALRRGEQV